MKSCLETVHQTIECCFGRPPDQDNISYCISRLLESETDGDAELDKICALGVTIMQVPPHVTGFKAWSRCEDMCCTEADNDRGHMDWVIPDGVDNDSPPILYLHGGGYQYYSPQDVYRPLTSRLAQAARMPLSCIDYRKIPEFRHPAQLEDAVQAFRWLSENGPNGPRHASKIFLAGDSAGGGLALALALRLRDDPTGETKVAGVVVMSPETDLTCSGASYTTRKWRTGGGPKCDPIFTGEDPGPESMDDIYLLLGPPDEPGSFHTKEPSISVLHAALHDLPPTLIHVGDAEVMLDDSVVFGEKARGVGSPVDVKVWPRMWHVFQMYSEGCGGPNKQCLEEALQSITEMGIFLQKLGG